MEGWPDGDDAIEYNESPEWLKMFSGGLSRRCSSSGYKGSNVWDGGTWEPGNDEVWGDRGGSLAGKFVMMVCLSSCTCRFKSWYQINLHTQPGVVQGILWRGSLGCCKQMQWLWVWCMMSCCVRKLTWSIIWIAMSLISYILNQHLTLLETHITHLNHAT